MSVLLRIEINRFLARRAVRVIGGAALMLVVAGASLTFAFSNRDAAGATTRERARASSEYRLCLTESGGGEGKCEAPDLASIHVDPRFHLSEIGEVFTNLGGNLVILGLLLGATFVGAEWHHRTMTNTLTWEPRRTRVALAKIAAAAIVVSASVLLLEALLAAALTPAAVFRGTTEGTSLAVLGHAAAVGARVAIVAAFAASVGAALALVARNTAFAIGISFLWLAVLEGIVRGTRPGWTPWLVGDNAAAFVGTTVQDGVRSGLAAGFLLSAYVALICAIAVGSFHRRDVA